MLKTGSFMSPPPPASAARDGRNNPVRSAGGGRVVVPFTGAYNPPPFAEPDPTRGAIQFARRDRLPRRQRLGDLLLERGAITPGQLARALDSQARNGARLGEVLLADGDVSEDTLMVAMAEQTGLGYIPRLPPLDSVGHQLARRLPRRVAVDHVAIPIRRIGGSTLIVTARPERVDALRRAVPEALRPCRFAIAPRAEIENRIADAMGERLARQAECSPPRRQSCRDWQRSRAGALVTSLGILAAGCFVAFPATSVQVTTLLGLAAMLCNLSLRLAAIRAGRAPRGPVFDSPRATALPSGPLPCVSVLIPLHREPGIVPALIRRMERLDYPRAALDILLVVEADDTETRAAIAATALPPWIRPIIVPDGHPRTKPRAMNYALNFARGRIVGIYDAEDAPEAMQIRRVVARFATAPPDLACLQGQLDFYNADRNWMARCFTVEYANWFRLMLPGLAKMGLVVPLGGTTLFFRRAALEASGSWDAHNVTEDADLGVRLARMGYRTEVIATTTTEEANAAPLAWVKQRSRWMKGYMMTWAVHASQPVQLMRDLGAKRFWGFHAHFLGSVLNALMLPFMWSTIVMTFGMAHPVARGFPDWFGPVLAWSMPVLTVLGITIACIGCSAPHHRHLRKWVPTMELYWPLATLAVAKALVELVVKPFHWDKTDHGAFGGQEEDAAQHVRPAIAAE